MDTPGQDSVQGTDYTYMIRGYHEKDLVKSGSVYDSSHSTTSSWHVPNPTFLYNGNGNIKTLYRYDATGNRILKRYNKTPNITCQTRLWEIKLGARLP